MSLTRELSGQRLRWATRVRNMQRKRQAYQEYGYTGLFDRRRGKRSIHRVPMETAEKILELYQTAYFDLSVRHFSREAEGRA